jgi:hypothetical protein
VGYNLHHQQKRQGAPTANARQQVQAVGPPKVVLPVLEWLAHSSCSGGGCVRPCWPETNHRYYSKTHLQGEHVLWFWPPKPLTGAQPPHVRSEGLSISGRKCRVLGARGHKTVTVSLWGLNMSLKPMTEAAAAAATAATALATPAATAVGLASTPHAVAACTKPPVGTAACSALAHAAVPGSWGMLATFPAQLVRAYRNTALGPLDVLQPLAAYTAWSLLRMERVGRGHGCSVACISLNFYAVCRTCCPAVRAQYELPATWNCLSHVVLTSHRSPTCWLQICVVTHLAGPWAFAHHCQTRYTVM